ncbi:MAG: hypothetical protein O3C20_08795, partial [Verrucomicrobia bacterium]|nr:hypothetical protein [Verrucomicrobiota bacterium]
MSLTSYQTAPPCNKGKRTNSFQICTRHGIDFRTQSMEFESRAHARVWMRENQKGRRNLTPAWKIELGLCNKADLLEIGMAKHAATVGRPSKESLSQNDNDFEEPKHNTRVEIAKAAGVSTGQVGMAEQSLP